MRKEIEKQFLESAAVKKRMAEEMTLSLVQAVEMLVSAYQAGKKVLVMGNGGSAADAQHLAGELVGRFQKERKALPCLALTTDSSIITAVGNDYSYETIFARQVEAWANCGDVVIALSTSGNSANVLAAVKLAKESGARVLGLTGKNGGKLLAEADLCLLVPSDSTPRIQEGHITIIHILCDLLEERLFGDAEKSGFFG